MGRRVFCFLIVQCCICKVLSIYAQPAMQQYIHLSGSPRSVPAISAPTTQHLAPNIPPANLPRPPTGMPSFSAIGLPELVSRLQQLPPIQQTAALPKHIANQARPTTGLNSLSALGLPNLVSGLQQQGPIHKNEVKASTSIDSNLLNNLAIALQLLIVSNILNAPPPVESNPKPKEIPCLEPNYNTNAAMPNSNFVGSTSFSEPTISQSYRPTRNSMSLMSPYEALSSSSPYSDTILSQYASTNPRLDFQSPYSMMTDTDVFSMNDLFQ